MRAFFALSIFALCYLGTTAQYNFLIYSVKGNVTVTDKKAETKAKIGTMLNAASVVKLAPSSTVILICNETNMFSITKAGTYTMSSFGDSCKAQRSSITANYVKYIWSQFTHGHASPESNRKLFMNNVGSVSRSVSSIWINPRLDSMNYTGGNFSVTWKSYSEAKEFEFQVYDAPAEGKMVYKAETKNKKFALATAAKQLTPGKTYYWTASPKGENNDELKAIKIWSKEEYNSFLASLNSVENSFETEAEKYFRLAFQLEEANFFAEAYEYYQKAAKLQPNMSLYTSTLESFKKDYEIN